MSSSSLPEGGAKLTLDLSEWEANWSSAMDQADDLTQTLDDISGSVDVSIDLTTTGDDAIEEIEALDGETISPELDTTESDTSKEIRDGINFLATVEAIKIAIDVVGTALDFVNAIANFVATPFLDVEDAVARINAQTGSGTGIADLGDFIRDIQAADLGENVDQISDMVIHATQLGAPIEEATTAALTFTKVFDDQNPVDVMTTLNTMAGEFKTSISEAGDLMTVAFQQGLNKGGDLISVVNANSSSWADMGLTAPEVLSTINSLMDNGVDSASDAAKMIQTFDDALTTAADNADSPQAEALKTLGMENPKDSGQAMGADFIDGFADSFANLPSDKQDLISGVLFGKGGKKFTGALEGMTTEGPFDDIKQAAADAATEIDNSLRGAIDDFILEVNTKIADLLSSDAIDLPGKITALKEGLQEAVDVIASGGSIGEAIEVGLNIPGFADGVSRFEASIGSFAISVLQLIASVQDTLGKDSSGTRREIARLAEGQLTFNLKVANPDEIGGEIQTALDRGVDASKISDLATAAGEELIAQGDVDRAQALANELDRASAVVTLSRAGRTQQVNVQQGVDETLEEFQARLAAAQASASAGGTAFSFKLLPDIDTAELQTQIDTAQKAIEQSMLDFGPKLAKANPLGAFGAEQGAKTSPFLNMPDFGGGETDNMFADAITAFQDVIGKSDETKTAVETNTTAMTTAAQTADLAIATALTGNTITQSFADVEAAADSSFPAVIDWFQETADEAATLDTEASGHIQHLLNLLHDLQFLSAQVATGVQATLALGAGLGGTTTNTTNNVTVNNNVPNGAAAAAGSYTLAASLRPGGA